MGHVPTKQPVVLAFFGWSRGRGVGNYVTAGGNYVADNPSNLG